MLSKLWKVGILIDARTPPCIVVVVIKYEQMSISCDPRVGKRFLSVV